MKKIIVVTGVSKRGKSQTIIEGYNLLRAKYPDAKVEELAASRGADIKVLITIDGGTVAA